MNEREEEVWMEIAPMKTARCHFGAVAMGEKIYVMGGYNKKDGKLRSMEVYDTVTNEWSSSSSLPNMKNVRDGCAAAVVKDKIYVVGGFLQVKHLSSCEVFDPNSSSTKKWSKIPQEMKQGRSGCAAVGIDDKLYVMGGTMDHGHRLASMEVYDTTTQTWSILPSMNRKRSECAAVGCKELQKIFVFGGKGSWHTYDSCEVYDIQTQQWKEVKNVMYEKRNGCSAVSLTHNLCIIVGGSFSHQYHSSCEILLLGTNKIYNFSIPHMSHARDGGSTVSIGGNRIYALGGHDNYQYLASGEVIHIHTDSFVPPSSSLQQQQQQKKRPRISPTTMNTHKKINNNDNNHHHGPDDDEDDKNDTSKSILERVVLLKDKLLGSDEDSILEQYIERMELKHFGEVIDSHDKTILERIETLEHIASSNNNNDDDDRLMEGTII